MTIKERTTHILVVEDEEQIRRALATILHSGGYVTEFAVNGDEAIARAIDKPPDLVILDLSFPGRTAIEVCRELRSWMRAPIVVLSVRSDEIDKIAALDGGADDYLTKPFSAGELLARVRALLRRARAPVTPPAVFGVADLVVDSDRRHVTFAGHEITSLTPTEFEILLYLARNAGLVVTHGQLLEHLWGSEWGADTTTLRTHMSNLRKKIEPSGGSRRYVFTVHGVGFRFASARHEQAVGVAAFACGRAEA